MRHLVLLIQMTAMVALPSLTLQAQTTIKLEKKGGLYLIPCNVNGLSLKFIFDTGASDVSLSLTEATFMLKNGYLLESDFTGTELYQVASGEIHEGYIVNLRSITIGGRLIKNVKATIVKNAQAPLLLGQSALSQLGKYQFDYANNSLMIIDKDELKSSAPVAEAPSSGGIIWLTIEEAQKRAERLPKPLMVYFYTSWCGPCNKLERTTFADPTLSAYVNSNYYPVKFNAEGDGQVRYRGRAYANPEYKEVRKGERNSTHQLTKSITKIDGQVAYPTIVFVDNSLNVSIPVSGYLNPTDMQPILVYFGAGHYRTVDYAGFLTSFRGHW